jgi:hypothetical protein
MATTEIEQQLVNPLNSPNCKHGRLAHYLLTEWGHALANQNQNINSFNYNPKIN